METENKEKDKVEGFESIELSKGMKGTYSWKIRMSGLDVEKMEVKNEELLERFKKKGK